MRKSKKGSFGRRGFLKGAAAGAAAFVAGPVAGAQQAPPAQSARAVGIVPPAGAVAAETEVAPPSVDVLTQGRPGADFMVDVIKSLGWTTSVPTRVRVSEGCMNRLSTMAETQNPSSSPVCMKRFRWQWPTGMRRSKASRLWFSPTAPWVCSMPRWRFTTRFAAGFPSSSSWGTRWTPQPAALVSNGNIRSRMQRRWSAIMSSGTTIRSRCPILPSLQFAHTKS
ncbi:MAG: hypothetical protein DMG11_10055 [Acidobacteria bacterium]|nr:MAG: hypothetical protein DMG11_10055 [Acidobacteriota bacterium]